MVVRRTGIHGDWVSAQTDAMQPQKQTLRSTDSRDAKPLAFQSIHSAAASPGGTPANAVFRHREYRGSGFAARAVAFDQFPESPVSKLVQRVR